MLDGIFTSLEQNIAIEDIDIAADLDAGELTFLLVIDCPVGLDPQSLVPGIADDALAMALGGPDDDAFQKSEPTLSLAFC
ncbi:hypothetical protein QFZ52_000586 [Arthrobacter woluwensis]|uniref:hypothetical protein n=1 Tax=Arthrobacter woluwensis TaxID=156980 RepID=UPI00278B6BD0|nr:hypothetical protein [Arthrobacter woluwensis]MDQ0707934.1 hypothetical protein [Arthrobacter woluwensis]